MRHLQLRSRLRDPKQGGSSVRPAWVRWASGALRPRRPASSPASRRRLRALNAKGGPKFREPTNSPYTLHRLEGEMAINVHLQTNSSKIMRCRLMERDVTDLLALGLLPRHRLRTRGGAAST
jgi:hypothetical protein